MSEIRTDDALETQRTTATGGTPSGGKEAHSAGALAAATTAAAAGQDAGGSPGQGGQHVDPTAMAPIKVEANVFKVAGGPASVGSDERHGVAAEGKGPDGGGADRRGADSGGADSGGAEDEKAAHEGVEGGAGDGDIDQEVAAALAGQDVDAMLEASAADAGQAEAEAKQSAKADENVPAEFHHEIRRGRVAAIRGEDVFIELGGEAGKMQGVVPRMQFDRSPRIGSVMDFVIDKVDQTQGLIYLSREGAINRATWEQLQRGAAVEARVISTNKGGLELEMVGGIRAFMPASHVDLHHVGELEPLVGQKLEGIVQEIDRRSKKVVVSRRHLLEQQREKAKKKLFEELEEGQTREGSVTKLMPFGAFVDLGGVDGLIHVSDLSYSHVDKPGEVVKVGQEVKVKVLGFDPEKERISLGLKQIEPNPWETIGQRIKAGDQVAARVLRTAHFGAFAEVESGVEALMPMSELSWKRIHRAEEVVQEGSVVHVRVMSIEPGKQRMSLSLKQAQGDPWIGAERKFEPNSQIEGKVVSTTDFGAFVELESGIEGLVHISELADRRVNNVEEEVKVGDVKRFRVLDVDEDQRRIRLSLRDKTKAQAEGAAAGASDQQGTGGGKPKKPRKKSRRDLKGGMGDNGGMGVGLGNLRL